MLTIGEPKITKVGNKKVRLSAPVEINNEVKDLWLEVDEKYAKYLVKDRSDAFLVALLPIAMRAKKEIICLAPVSEELLHNIRTQLIPTLAKSGKGFYKSRISAEISRHPIKSAGAIGTGLSRGIDSMHVLNNYLEPEYPDFKLTHVCINDVGAFSIAGYSEGGRDAEQIKQECFDKSIQLAKDLDLPYIVTKSNLAEDFNANYVLDHIYCNLFPVFALQKLFKLYYYGSSGWDYTEFSLKDSDRKDCAYYELLIDNLLSTSNLKIFPEGAEKNRLEKTEDIVHFVPAQNNLHVCITGSENCSRCSKCMRTMLSLDALDCLDYFGKVFDVDYYKHNKRLFINYLERCHANNDRMNEPTYQAFEKKRQLTNSKPELLADGIILPATIHSSAVIIKNLSTNKLLMRKQNHDYFAAVGFAKIMTALIALENGNLNITVPISDTIAGGLKYVSLYDLINILLISQNNEVADVIAETVSGNVENFVELMNKKLKLIHAFESHFATPTGLTTESYITADDAGLITEYAIQNENFCKIFKSSGYVINSGYGTFTVKTQNPLLQPESKYYMPEILGSKFGLMGIYGNTLAITKHGNNVYMLIILGVKEGKGTMNRFADAKNLLESVARANV